MPRTIFRNLNFHEHDEWKTDIKYESPVGTDFDFTGYTPHMKVMEAEKDGKEIVNLSDDITLSTGNINIDKVDTKDVAAGIYKFDIIIDDGTKQHTIVFGNFRIKPRYTEKD